MGSYDEKGWFYLRLFIVRHGESYSNTGGKIMSTTDLPLTEKGEKQAAAAGAYLRETLGVETFHQVFASPLQRARQTAEIITGGHAGITILKELREMELGELEGLTLAEQNARYPGVDIDRALSRTDLPGGETYQSVYARCKQFLDSLAIHAHDNVLIATHGITMRVLINCILNKPDASVDYINWSDNAAITEIVFHLDNTRELKRLGDRQHLLDSGLGKEDYEKWGLFSEVEYETV
jgi:probable phosphoglycerate mutase